MFCIFSKTANVLSFLFLFCSLFVSDLHAMKRSLVDKPDEGILSRKRVALEEIKDPGLNYLGNPDVFPEEMTFLLFSCCSIDDLKTLKATNKHLHSEVSAIGSLFEYQKKRVLGAQWQRDSTIDANNISSYNFIEEMAVFLMLFVAVT